MPDHPNQPHEYDAVLGEQTPIPTSSAILGGIEGIKRRWASAIEEQRIAALSEALKYGEAGLDLVIRALQDESVQVEKTAYLLLSERAEPGPGVKYALRSYTPWRLLTCLRTLIGHSGGSVGSVVISPDGQTLVSASKADNTIKVWHLMTGELLRTIEGHTGYFNSIAISPDGKTIVSGSNNTINVWNLVTGELLRTLKGHSSSLHSIAISPDGQTLVSGTGDKIIEVWHFPTRELKTTLEGHSSSVYSVAISPDGKTIVSGSQDGTIKIWGMP